MIGPERHAARSGWAFLAPALLLIAVFFFLPVLVALLWMVAALLMPPSAASWWWRRPASWVTGAGNCKRSSICRSGSSSARTPGMTTPSSVLEVTRSSSASIACGSSHYQLDAKDISGPLDAQVIEACCFVARNIKVAARKRMGRKDYPQYDMAAVFEALVNAVAHRDYSIHGSKIRLRVFNNRLELYSPGGLPNSLESESLPYRQAARNETLASLLARCPVPAESEWLETTLTTLMDRRGEGVPIILNHSKARSGKLPTYRVLDESELLLTIFAAKPQDEVTSSIASLWEGQRHEQCQITRIPYRRPVACVSPKMGLICKDANRCFENLARVLDATSRRRAAPARLA